MAQWGIAYVAAAWALLQGIDFLADAFHWPDAAKQIATLVLLIGLPVVLVLAWFHGDRGEQRAGAAEIGIIAVLLLLLGGGALLWLYDPVDETPTSAVLSETSPAAATAAGDTRPSIAVLPFENRSRLEDDAFFVDGIHDDILTQLTKIGAMKVIARTSVEQFRDTNLTTREIAQKLGVAKILEGGVQRAGDRVRVTVQLIDTHTDTHLWAESYDRELTVTNIFAIQSEVAAAVAGALKTALTPAEQARAKTVPTQNLQAWEAYQLGQQRMAKRASADLADAELFFREAIDLDPQFALAYLGLADTLDLQVRYSGAPREPALSNAETAVAEALQLDPNLGEAWTSAGLLASDRWQYDRAESMFRRAIELNPNYAPARHWYSIMLVDCGRLDEALAQIRQAVQLDPLYARTTSQLGNTLVANGKFHEAEAVYRRAIAIDPTRHTSYAGLAALNAYALNRFADAVPLERKAMDLESGSPWTIATLARLYLDLGDVRSFIDTTAPATKRWPDHHAIQFNLALGSLVRRDAVGAMGAAQRAYDANPRGGALVILRDAHLQDGRYGAALALYEEAYPELFRPESLRIDGSNYRIAIDLALVFQSRGDSEQASTLLDGATGVIRTTPRLGIYGYGISDVQIHALRGQKAKALAALRDAGRAGWRGPLWRYYRDFEPNLDSIRNEPEFKAIFADIERDMAKQRARLAARPKDATLKLEPNDARAATELQSTSSTPDMPRAHSGA